MSPIDWYRRKRKFGVLFWLIFVALACVVFFRVSFVAAVPQALHKLCFIFTQEGLSSYSLATGVLPDVERLALQAPSVQSAEAVAVPGRLELTISAAEEGFVMADVLDLYQRLMAYARGKALGLTIASGEKQNNQNGELENISRALDTIAANSATLRFALLFSGEAADENGGLSSLIYLLEGNKGIAQYSIQGIPRQYYEIELRAPEGSGGLGLANSLASYITQYQRLTRDADPLRTETARLGKTELSVNIAAALPLEAVARKWLGNQALLGYQTRPTLNRESADFVSVNGQEAVIVNCAFFQNSQLSEQLSELLARVGQPEKIGFSGGTSLLVLNNPLQEMNAYFFDYLTQFGVGLVLIAAFILIFYRSLYMLFMLTTSLIVALAGIIFLYFLTGLNFSILSMGMVVLSLGIVMDATLIYSARLGRASQENQASEIARSVEDIVSSILTNCIVLLPLFFTAGDLRQLALEIAGAFFIANVASAFSALLYLPFVLSIFPIGERARTFRLTPFPLSKRRFPRIVLSLFSTVLIVSLVSIFGLPKAARTITSASAGEQYPVLAYSARSNLSLQEAYQFTKELDQRFRGTMLDSENIARISRFSGKAGSLEFFGLNIDPGESDQWHRTLQPSLEALAAKYGFTLDFRRFGEAAQTGPAEISVQYDFPDFGRIGEDAAAISIRLGGADLKTLNKEATRFLDAFSQQAGIVTGGFARDVRKNDDSPGLSTFWLKPIAMWTHRIQTRDLTASLERVSGAEIELPSSSLTDPVYTIVSEAVALAPDPGEAFQTLAVSSLKLAEFVELEPSETFFNTAISRKDQQFIIDCLIVYDTSFHTATAVFNKARAFFGKIDPAPGVVWVSNSSIRETTESAFPVILILFSGIIILAILIGHFESFGKGLLCFLTVPLSLLVSVAALLLVFGLSLGTGLGLLVLCGLVVNDSILFVSQLGHYEAIMKRRALDAARLPAMSHLRNIALSSRQRGPQMISTSVTTILFILPGFIAQTASPISAFWLDLGGTIIIGMVVSTLFSLFVLPSISAIRNFPKR